MKSRVGPILAPSSDLSVMPYLALDGTFEDELVNWLPGNLRPGDTFVDVGANIGWFTVIAAKAVGKSGCVVAIEADPRNYELLLDNISINYVSQWVTPLNVAAWYESGTVAFHRSTKFYGNSSINAPTDHLRNCFPGDRTESITVKSVVLDEALAHLPRIDVLKMDIEGAEIHALAGMNELLASARVKALVLEINRTSAAANWPSFSDWLLDMPAKGWSITDLTTDLEVSAEDLVRHGNYPNVALTRSRAT